MHVLRFTLCGNQGLKQRQLNRAHCQLNNYGNEWSVMVSDNYCLTVYCLTVDSWTEFVLTSTETEKAHLKSTLLQIPSPVSPSLKKGFRNCLLSVFSARS